MTERGCRETQLRRKDGRSVSQGAFLTWPEPYFPTVPLLNPLQNLQPHIKAASAGHDGSPSRRRA